MLKSILIDDMIQLEKDSGSSPKHAEKNIVIVEQNEEQTKSVERQLIHQMLSLDDPEISKEQFCTDKSPEDKTKDNKIDK